MIIFLLHWPQCVVIAIYAIGLLLAARDHGKPKKGKQSFWTSLIASVLMLYLLSAGGFFNQ